MQASGAKDIQRYFGDTLPNLIYGNGQNLDLKKITKTANVRTSRSDAVLKNSWMAGDNLGSTNKTVSNKNAECEALGNGDSFDHLVSLNKSQDRQSRLRCGWVYDNSKPDNGRGAYGNSEGPFKTSASGTWIWNLDVAQQKYHTAICQGVQGCQDIGASMYKNRCGWCSKSGKAVPIVGNSTAYPFNSNTACSPNNLLTSPSQCPVKVSSGSVNGTVTVSSIPGASSIPGVSSSLGFGGLDSPQDIQVVPAQPCDPLPNGAVPRDCLLRKVVTAGCSDEGTLYRSLRSGSDNDYLSDLKQQKAWSIYQQRATIPANNTGLQSGKITVSDALNDFKRIQDQASSDTYNGLNYAARDLCFRKGALEEFDFCSEIQDVASGPFSLDCLQKAFLRGGGQKAGAAYPKTSNMSNWNSIGSWASVKQYIQSLFALTRSGERKTQEKAMMDFYGIKMQNKQNPLPYGPEIAWKDRSVILSCERPITFTPGYTVAQCISDDSGEMVDTAANRLGYKMGMPPPIPPPCQFKPPPSGNGYAYQGCYKDDSSRTITNYLGNTDSTDECAQKVAAAGFNVMGRQYFGQCFGGNNTDWDRLGPAECCPPTGGAWTNQVFKITPVPIGSSTSATVAEHCDNGGWKVNLKTGVSNAGTDFPRDASYITVPPGYTAILTTNNNQTRSVVGPSQFSFCSVAGFNDNVRSISLVGGVGSGGSPSNFGTPLQFVGGGDIKLYNNNYQIVVLNDNKFPAFPGAVGYKISGKRVTPGTTVTGYRFGKSNFSSRYEVIFMDLSQPVSGADEPVYYSP
jgi:hypothetical protein